MRGDGGCPCCGAQNFYAALRRTLKILGTATGTSAPTDCLPIEFRRGRRPRRPAPGLRSTARVAPTKSVVGADAPVRPWAFLGCVMRRGEGTPPLHYIMLLCGAWGRGCKRPFPRQQGGGAPRPADGIFASYLFRSSKLSAVTMDWTLVHRGAKVLARSS